MSKIIKMPVSWFDREENQVSKLMDKFSTSFKVLSDFIELYIPFLTIIMVNIIFCTIGSICFEWRTGLTSMGLIPILIISQAIQLMFVAGFN